MYTRTHKNPLPGEDSDIGKCNLNKGEKGNVDGISDGLIWNIPIHEHIQHLLRSCDNWPFGAERGIKEDLRLHVEC